MQADLLATAFSEAIERINYKRFLEKEIKQYLRVSTTELSKDCVIFVAEAKQPGVCARQQHDHSTATCGSTSTQRNCIAAQLRPCIFRHESACTASLAHWLPL